MYLNSNRALAEVVLRGIKPHPILKLAIKAAEETVAQACVTEGSLLIGKTLKEAGVHEETGMWVQVIKRGEKTLRPKGDSRIQKGDVLIASGYADGVESFRKLASPEQICRVE